MRHLHSTNPVAPVQLLSLALLVSLLALASYAEDSYNEDYDNGEDEADYEAAAEDDGASAPSWLPMSAIPQHCVSNNGADSIIWSVYDDSSDNTCASSDLALTMITPVSDFVKQYYEYVVTVETNADAYYEQDQYRDDDAYECAADPNGGGFYVKLGCSPSSIYAIGFVAFTDDACLYEKRSSEQQEGDEVVAYDTGIDASFWQITFGTCQSCIDYNVYQEMVENAEDDEELDFDQLNDESFCNLVWGESAVCGDDCQAMGMSTGNSTWEAREIVFLALELCAFFALSMGIFQKRQSMSSKELLIEQATAAHFDMKRIHLVGGCLGTLIIVVCFAAAKLVSATLGFMLALDLGALFYLLKLTLF